MRTAVILLALTLFGCSSTNRGEAPVKPAFHPPMPAPIQVCPINWVVLEYEGAPYVALTYNDNVQGAICNRDVYRYIKELQRVTCTYRQELDEAVCLQFKKEVDER